MFYRFQTHIQGLLDANTEESFVFADPKPKRPQSAADMKSSVVMVAIMLIWDFIFMFLELDLVLYILGYFTFYMSHYLG